MTRVYFIKPIGLDGPVKIGFSSAPEKRRSALETWSPFALEVIAEIDGGFDLEQRFHALFQDTHQRREWFGSSKLMAAVIAAIQAGTFDIATLPAPMNVSANPLRGKGAREAEWTPLRRFEVAYHVRTNILVKAGMPSGGVPYFSSWGKSEAEIAEFVRVNLPLINEMSARYRPDMPLVRLPGELLTPVDGAAA